MGDPNASIPTPQPILMHPMFGATNAGDISAAFVCHQVPRLDQKGHGTEPSYPQNVDDTRLELTWERQRRPMFAGKRLSS